MKFLIASGNCGKIGEMRALLAEHEVITPAELGISVEIDETGETFRENALLKAVHACKLSNLPSIADDSGLCADALGGEPGVHSKRWGGAAKTDGELVELLLRHMEDKTVRTARFISHIVCAFPGGGIVEAEGVCEGEIVREPRGTDGFGYDPVFYVTGQGRTMAELDVSKKNAVSHRGAAMRGFLSNLKKYMEENPC